MDNMYVTEKALEAVGSLAALVEAMKDNHHSDTVTMSRYEYESLLCNQVPAPASKNPFRNGLPAWLQSNDKDVPWAHEKRAAQDNEAEAPWVYAEAVSAAKEELGQAILQGAGIACHRCKAVLMTDDVGVLGCFPDSEGRPFAYAICRGCEIAIVDNRQPFDPRNPGGLDENPRWEPAGGLADLRQQLLAEAATKPIRHFTQHDCFFYDQGKPDRYVTFGVTELRNHDCLRVQVPTSLSYERAIGALEQVIADMREDMMKDFVPGGQSHPRTDADVAPF